MENFAGLITDWIGLHSFLLPLLIVFFWSFYSFLFTLFDVQEVFLTFLNADKYK